jgi:hypothetical protein
MTFRKRGFRAMVLGLLIAAGLALAPAAFARGHVDIGVSVPGVSLGYCHHCGYRGGYGYVGYYDGYYAPAPVYYDDYYAPYPAYGAVYYSPHRYYHRYYYRDRYGYYHHGYR